MKVKHNLIAFSTICMLSFMACNDRNPDDYNKRNDDNIPMTPNSRDVDDYNHAPPLGDTLGDTLDYRADKPL